MLFAFHRVVEPPAFEESGVLFDMFSIAFPVEPVELVGFSPIELVVPSGVFEALVPAVVSV